MDGRRTIAALDVGTTKTCAVVASLPDGGEPEIIGVGSCPGHGLKKGSVVHINKTVDSIRRAMDEAGTMSGVPVAGAVVGVAGSHVHGFNSTGVVSVEGAEIGPSDVDRALDAAKAVVVPSDREIIHVVPREFRVDDIQGVKDPVGMCGTRLEARVHVVTGAVPLLQNLVKCVEEAGVRVEGIVLQPLASSRAVLSPEEREMGTVLVDVGGGTTDMAVWKDGGLVHSQIVPVGGGHFTGDLAVALRIPHAEAERVKTAHGSVLRGSGPPGASVAIQGIPGTRPREASLGLVSDVLAARAEELFGILRESLESRGLDDAITGGVVLTGGGSLLGGLTALGEYVMEKPAKTGHPLPFGGMARTMRDPKFSTALGLLLEARDMRAARPRRAAGPGADIIGRLGGSLRSALREIF